MSEIDQSLSSSMQSMSSSTQSMSSSIQSDGQNMYSHYRHCLSQCISQVSTIVQQLTDIKGVYYPTTLSDDAASIFRLDTKDKHSVEQDAHVLSNKLSVCLHHLDSLSKRVYDSSSKILVTGDLNSGKSTLVNALLRRNILPTDQQPCTSIFSEVWSIPADKEKEPVIHAIQDIDNYDRGNPGSYDVIKVEDLYRLNIDMEDNYKLLKIYTYFGENDHGLLVRNGIMDITLIDSPGLNTDSVKTTAVFAKEEEIDVVIFVVSAENHFTLSGKEFLGNAANDKLHVFIVVNRFDSIRDKDRCKRLILEQIRQLSPSTYENAAELVHFISAENEVDSDDFIRLEQTLNSFVFQHRIQSKLLPAKNYLSNVLRDVYFVASVNESKSQDNYEQHVHELQDQFLPGYSRLLSTRANVTHDIHLFIQNATALAETRVMQSLKHAISDEVLEEAVQSVPYPGIIMSWQYAQSMAHALSDHLESNLQAIETAIDQDSVKYLQKMDSLASEPVTQYSPSKRIRHPHRRLQIYVEPRDFLRNRKMVDTKKWLLGGVVGTGLIGISLQYMDMKTISWSIVTTYFGLDSTVYSPRFLNQVLRVAVFCNLAWTGYSFITAIPAALKENLKRKFQTAAAAEQFCLHQSQHVTQALHHLLDTKQTEIISHIENKIAQQTQRKIELERLVQESEANRKKFQSLVTKSNELRDKLDETMDIRGVII